MCEVSDPPKIITEFIELILYSFTTLECLPYMFCCSFIAFGIPFILAGNIFVDLGFLNEHGPFIQAQSW